MCIKRPEFVKISDVIWDILPTYVGEDLPYSVNFSKSQEELGMHMVFDISHNRGTFEKHEVDGKVKELIVHRKGATGSYHPGREEIPEFYRKGGSPVIIGGSMETGSYLLAGGPNAKRSVPTAHGSGRTMSRAKAKRMVRGEKIPLLTNGDSNAVCSSRFIRFNGYISQAVGHVFR